MTRSKLIQIRCRPEELEAIKENAKAAGKPVSSYLRDLGMIRDWAPPPADAVERIAREVETEHRGMLAQEVHEEKQKLLAAPLSKQIADEAEELADAMEGGDADDPPRTEQNGEKDVPAEAGRQPVRDQGKDGVDSDPPVDEGVAIETAGGHDAYMREGLEEDLLDLTQQLKAQEGLTTPAARREAKRRLGL